MDTSVLSCKSPVTLCKLLSVVGVSSEKFVPRWGWAPLTEQVSLYDKVPSVIVILTSADSRVTNLVQT